MMVWYITPMIARYITLMMVWYITVFVAYKVLSSVFNNLCISSG